MVAAGLAADRPERAGTLYEAAAALAGMLVLPLSATALVTGLVCALGTPWGLFRHYWVAAKLVLTAVLVAGSNLLLVPAAAELAAATEGGSVLPPYADRFSLVAALSVSLSVLVATTLLSTVKPFGRIRRRPRPPASARAPERASAGVSG
nr:hypothetical protein [Streptomonospora sp. PA3]